MSYFNCSILYIKSQSWIQFYDIMSIMNDQVTPAETTELLRLAEQALASPGDFVELGCYRGDTSVLLGKLIASHNQATTSIHNLRPNSHSRLDTTCGKPVENYQQAVDILCKNSRESVENQCKTPRHLWIYDSFAGLPAKTVEDASGAGANFQAGELLVSKREVVDKIRRAGLRNVIIKKAWFNQLADRDLPSQIAFAFLDGDLYSSIKASLHLVAPRLAPQGIMVVHDYNNPELPGSARAVDEFLRAHSAYRLQVRYSLAIIVDSSSK